MSELQNDIGKIVFGVNIVLVGLFILLGNVGVVGFGYLPYLVKFWPLIIIAAGLDLLTRYYKIGYIGSLIFTAFLVLATIACVPGPNGSGVRRFMAMPEEPTTWNQMFKDWHWWGWERDSGIVAETRTGKIEHDAMPARLNIVLNVSEVDWVDVTVHKSEKFTVSSELGLKSKTDEQDFSLQIVGVKVQMGEPGGGTFVISPVANNPGGIHYNVKLDIGIDPKTSLALYSSSGNATFMDNWAGSVYFSAFRNGGVQMKDLEDELAIETTSGSIKAGTVKSLKVKTTSGDIEITGCKGFADAFAVSGSVMIGSFDGGNIQTTSGRISIGNVTGNAKVYSISGDIDVTKVEGIIDLKSTSGGIWVDNANIQSGQSTVHAVSGGIEIGFDKASNVTGYFTSVSGGVSIKGFDNYKDGHEENFVIGKGTGVINISSVSGGIRIRTAQ